MQSDCNIILIMLSNTEWGDSVPIELYSHNETAYANALSLLKTDKKAAIIHPTGTGKSFIAFKLCEDNPAKTVCWLSPSQYIFDTQLENLKRAADGYTPQNIIFFTYAKLINMSAAEISQIKPDYIILDEFHRCGAEVWGKGVEVLISAYPDVPILGLSATAIRYLDNQRNMADELFDGNIASEMTLGEAIVCGILAPPKYVLSAYSCKKDLNEYKRRVAGAKSKAVRDSAEKYLDALRRALDKADGLADLFDKHMTERTGKYIVFCADHERMKSMMELAPQWFAKVDAEPHIYSLYSEDPSTDEQFRNFKNDDDNSHLRLLYCIDALNEGVHVDDISGVVLLRPTVSPIIYKQQIGRALQTGISNSSVIFDIVLNIENLYSIGTIEDEMQLAVGYYRSVGREEQIVNEHFRVIDEVKDCIKLFEKLNETLTASWDCMYDEAKKYYERHGNLDVPKRYKTADGYSLGNWVLTQKRVYNGAANGLLTERRIAKLNAIGMVWESRRDMQWHRYYAAARKYSDAFSNLNVPVQYVTADGLKLGRWIANLRSARKNGFDSKYLTADRVRALDDIGMNWDVSDWLWQRYYEACNDYKNAHGNLDVPNDWVMPNGVRLGCWINNIRTSCKNANGGYRLSAEQIALLDELGMIWDKKHDRVWNKNYEAAKSYFAVNGDLNVPPSYTTDDGFALGKWIERQRNNADISPERKKKLDEIGMAWRKESSWERRFALAKSYFEANGDLNIKTNFVADGVWLGKWLAEQKKKHKDGTLSADYAKRLEQIGVDWNTDVTKKFDDAWEQNFLMLKSYCEKHGTLPKINKDAYSDERKLNFWLKRQRQSYKNNKLSAEKIEKLASVGVIDGNFKKAQ